MDHHRQKVNLLSGVRHMPRTRPPARPHRKSLVMRRPARLHLHPPQPRRRIQHELHLRHHSPVLRVVPFPRSSSPAARRIPTAHRYLHRPSLARESCIDFDFHRLPAAEACSTVEERRFSAAQKSKMDEGFSPREHHLARRRFAQTKTAHGPKGPAPPFIYSLFSEYQNARGLLGHASSLYLPHGTNNLRQKSDV